MPVGVLPDLRHAVRQFRARPGFTRAALALLAVGIGANTAAFSIVHGLLFQPLPYPDADALVGAGRRSEAVGPAYQERPGSLQLSYDELRRLRDGARSFEDLAGVLPIDVVLDGPGGPSRPGGAAVSPSLFPLLRVTPRLGRLFTEADAGRVVLLSHRAWIRRFGSALDVVGAPIDLNDERHTIIGVLPGGPEHLFPAVELWTPLVAPPTEVLGDDALRLTTTGRLRPGVSPAAAAAEARTILARAGAGGRSAEAGSDVVVTPLREERGRPFRPALLMLAAATGLVLLMTCANVGGLLFLRGIARRREMAVRGALGAGRFRIARQLLAECIVLGVAGGVIGLAVAAGIVQAAPALIPETVPGLTEAGLGPGVLAFAIGLAAVTSLVFGAAPALMLSRVDPARALGENGAAAGRFGRLRSNRIQAAAVVLQVAIAFVLLAGAALLLRSFVALVSFDTGYDPANVAAFSVSLPAAGGVGALGEPVDAAANHAPIRPFLTRMERITRLPGVDAVALSSSAPLFPTTRIQPIGVPDRPPTVHHREQLLGAIRTVSPGYADVLRLPVRAGRFFSHRDTATSPRVVVVSESFARRAFGNVPAVGRRLAHQADNETWKVIGVVADARSPFVPSFFTDTIAGDVYLSMLQPGMGGTFGRELSMVTVRTDRVPLAVLPFLREVFTDVHPFGSGTLEGLLAAQAAQPGFYAACAGVFGVVALMLAAFGLHTVLGHTVAQRRREIGIRTALGAEPHDVVELVVRQGGALVGSGIVLGLLGAAASSRIVDSVLFGVAPADPLTLAAAAALLLAVALLACWLPARRAVRIDPMDVLREA